jgi:hypothetical protein
MPLTHIDPGFSPARLSGSLSSFSPQCRVLESDVWQSGDRLRDIFRAYAPRLVERSIASSTQASGWQQAPNLQVGSPQAIATSDAGATTQRLLTAWIAARHLDVRAIEKGHRMLLGGNAQPGFRSRGECRIRCRHSGAVIYTPPAADRVSKLMDDLVEFIATDQLPGISKAFIAMLQLLLIHPFTDGNGRCARLLFAAICVRGGCDHPIALLALARLYGRGGTRLHAGSAVLRATGSWQSYLDSCARSVEEAITLWEARGAPVITSTPQTEADRELETLWWRAAAG